MMMMTAGMKWGVKREPDIQGTVRVDTEWQVIPQNRAHQRRRHIHRDQTNRTTFRLHFTKERFCSIIHAVTDPKLAGDCQPKCCTTLNIWKEPQALFAMFREQVHPWYDKCFLCDGTGWGPFSCELTWRMRTQQTALNKIVVAWSQKSHWSPSILIFVLPKLVKKRLRQEKVTKGTYLGCPMPIFHFCSTLLA